MDDFFERAWDMAIGFTAAIVILGLAYVIIAYNSQVQSPVHDGGVIVETIDEKTGFSKQLDEGDFKPSLGQTEQ